MNIGELSAKDFVKIGHDVARGFETAIQERNKSGGEQFQKDDLVIVVNPGQSYGGLFEFFKRFNLPVNLAARYCYYEAPESQTIHRVIYAGSWEYAKEPIYCIESADIHSKVYLIGESGLKKVGVADKEFFETYPLSGGAFCAR